MFKSIVRKIMMRIGVLPVTLKGEAVMTAMTDPALLKEGGVQNWQLSFTTKTRWWATKQDVDQFRTWVINAALIAAGIKEEDATVMRVK